MQSRLIIHSGLCREEQQKGFPGLAVTLTQGTEITCPRVIAIRFLRMEAVHIREQGVAAVEGVELRVELTT